MRITGCIVTLNGARKDVITGLVLPEDGSGNMKRDPPEHSETAIPWR